MNKDPKAEKSIVDRLLSDIELFKNVLHIENNSELGIVVTPDYDENTEQAEISLYVGRTEPDKIGRVDVTEFADVEYREFKQELYPEIIGSIKENYGEAEISHPAEFETLSELQN